MLNLRNPTSRRIRFLAAAALLAAVFAGADFANAGSGITYQGRIRKPDGSPLEGTTVTFKLQIRTPGSQNCLMYEEQQTLDMRNSNGLFNLTMNSTDSVRTDATGFTLDRIFGNRGTFNFTSGCASGSTYSPNAEDGRMLVVSFKDETMASFEQIPPTQLNFVPMAIESQQVAGFKIASLLRVQEADGTMGNVSPLSNASYTELLALIAGTSTQYVRNGSTAGARVPTYLGNPASPVAGSIWFDTSSNQLKFRDTSGVQTVGTSGGSVSSVTAGTGLATTPSGGITSTGSIAIAVGGVVSTMIADGSVITAKIADGAVTDVKLANGAVATAKIADGAVTTVKIADSAVSTLKISDSAVTSVKIADGTIAGADLASNITISTTGSVTASGFTTSGTVTANAVTAPTVSAGLNITRQIQLFDPDAGSTNKITFSADSALASDYTLTWPLDDGAANQVLMTDGSGKLSWTTITPGSGDFKADGSVSMTGNLRLGGQWLSNDGGNEGLRVDNSGKVGVGTATPQELLDINGAIRVGTTTTCGAPNPGTIRYNTGNLEYCNGTAWQVLGVAGAGITALTGDVTASGTGSVAATIANKAVTFAKIQDIATNKLIGRSTASTGAMEELSVGTGLSLSAGTLTATATGLPGCADGQLAIYVTSAWTCVGVTSANTASTVVRRDSSGNFVAGSATLTSSLVLKDGAAGGQVSIATPVGFTSYALTLPSDDGTPGQVLSTNGSGVTSWVAQNAGSVTSVTSANSDISVATTTSTPVLTLNSGTGANQIVKLDGTGKLPAVDGSALTGVTPSYTGLTAGRPLFATSATAVGQDSNFFWDNTNKRLGIGTSTPQTGLDLGSGSLNMAVGSKIYWGYPSSPTNISADSSNVNFVIGNGYTIVLNKSATDFTFQPDPMPTNNTAGSNFTLGGGATCPTCVDKNGGNLILTGGSSRGTGTSEISFKTAAAGTTGSGLNNPAVRMTINGDGSVGIGTTSPKELLDVAGAIRVGTTTTCGAPNPGTIRYNSGSLEYCNGTAWQVLGIAGSGITALTGDVTASGTGSVAATIANNAITSAKITDGTIATADVADSAVTSLKIADGTVATADIADKAVTFAKVQDMATNKLLGRSTASAGPMEELTVGTGLSLSGGTLSSTLTGMPACSNGELALYVTSAWTCVGAGSTNTASTVVRRDSSGNFIAGSATLTTSLVLKDGAAGGGVTIATPVGFTSYSLTLPVDDGTANQVLTTNGSGVLSWTSPSIVTPGDNVGLGTGTLANLTTGTKNSVVGYQAGNGITSHSSITAIGYQAAYTLAAGASSVIAIGEKAGFNGAGIKSNNTAIGTSALQNGDGSENNAIGFQAMWGNDGSNNIGMGSLALVGGVGSGNIGIGPTTGWYVNGTESVFIGRNVFNNSAGNTTPTTGDKNTVVGAYAASKDQPRTGSYNVIMGTTAGRDLSSGSNNTLIGFDAGKLLATGNNNILLGANLQTPTTSTSNYLSIGNAIYGDLSTGYIGIGIAVPTQKLHVNGSVLADAYLYTSDRRLKKDFQPLDQSLDKLVGLSTVKYRWITPANPEADREQIGLIAQEVQQVYPQAVHQDDKGWLRLDYSALIAPIVDSIREIYHRVTGVEAKTEALEKQVTELQRKNLELEQRLQRLEESLNSNPSRQPASK